MTIFNLRFYSKIEVRSVILNFFNPTVRSKVFLPRCSLNFIDVQGRKTWLITASPVKRNSDTALAEVKNLENWEAKNIICQKRGKSYCVAGLLSLLLLYCLGLSGKSGWNWFFGNCFPWITFGNYFLWRSYRFISTHYFLVLLFVCVFLGYAIITVTLKISLVNS